MMLNFIFSYFNNSQIWLDWLIDDCHLSNITKLKKKWAPQSPQRVKKSFQKQGKVFFGEKKKERKGKINGVIVNTNKVWPFFNGED